MEQEKRGEKPIKGLKWRDKFAMWLHITALKIASGEMRVAMAVLSAQKAVEVEGWIEVDLSEVTENVFDDRAPANGKFVH